MIVSKSRSLYKRELYNIFSTMHARCSMTPITERWYDFNNFYDDMINEYSQKIIYYPDRVMTLDRINCYGIYEPSNCRLIPLEAQGCNKSNNRIYYLYNQAWTQSQLYRSFAVPGISLSAFKDRLDNGWSIDEAANVPTELSHHKKSYFFPKHPILSMDEIYKKHTMSQFLDPRDNNELFNYDPRNIEEIVEERKNQNN